MVGGLLLFRLNRGELQFDLMALAVIDAQTVALEPIPPGDGEAGGAVETTGQ